MRKFIAIALITVMPMLALGLVNNNYIGPFLGINYLGRTSINTGVSSRTVSFKKGNSYGIELGHQVTDVRYEFEYLHTTSDTTNDTASSNNKSHAQSDVAMANVSLITMQSPKYFVEPFIGLGVGIGRFKMPTQTINNISYDSKTRTTLAYQAMLGAIWHVTESIDTVVDYRYLASLRTTFYKINNISERDEFQMHTINLSLQWRY